MSATRVLVYAPYPPWRDGIGSYALQQVRAMRRDGMDVEVCSPLPSAAHHHLDARGVRGALALARLARGYDRVVLHFHPDLYYEVPATPGARLSTGTALALAIRSMPPTTIVLHEVDDRWAAPADPSSRATRAVFRAAAEVQVHVTEHREMMTGAFGVDASKVRVVDHGADFVVRVAEDRSEARDLLGVPADAHVFLCIGFVQPHKGFDRAMAAFGDLADAGALLYVVGSVRVDDAPTTDHVALLRRLAATTPGVELRLGYLSDDRFDRWIVAADTIVLPYREIWSSGVAERARLYGRPVIATRVGGLAGQLAGENGVQLVADDVGLALAMRRAVSSPGDEPRSRTDRPWHFEGAVGREDVQAEIRRRAGTGSSSRAARRGVVAPTGASASSPLRQLPPLSLPDAVSARPGVSSLKKLIRRVINWELDPMREQLARFQRATVESVDVLDARLDEVEDHSTGGHTAPD